MSHGHNIYCLMNSGKPLTPVICDVLLFNAYDMWHEHRRIQKIKSRSYDGMIETNLQVVEFNGMGVVSFLANISTDQYQSNEVHFVVRLEDFDGIPEGEWQQLQIRVVGPRGICGCEKCQERREDCGCNKCRFEMRVVEHMENQHSFNFDECTADDEDDSDHNLEMN